ncbi:UNVERIFIED_CONTAM: hypothetical protein PYX00_004757 [Menopon gallinae]|uniref:Osiris 16 n=1 Tax=Menopon gallinae TaxID=328185 RepID=A0AAW2I562_9NEOP
MSVYWVPLLLFAVGPVRSVLSANDTATDSPGEGSASDIVRKVIAKGCAKKYTVTCFKMDMVNLVDLLSETDSYQIFPGISVVSDNATEGPPKKLPDTVIRSLARDFPYGEDRQLDEYLIGRISEYLTTHSVSLKLLDPQTAEKAKSLKARGKGNKGSLMAGLMMMKGTLMTIGFGALAALAGKALMTALLSLMLSAILGLRSSNQGHAHKQTTYEIISKPIYSHSHTHSAEIQHEHDHGHGHAASYAYGRNLDYNDGTRAAEVEYIQLPATKEDGEFDNKRAQAYEYGNVEYKTISDEDLKNYYNNLEFAASRNHELKYRKQKTFPENNYFPPLTTVTPPTVTANT